MSVNKEAYLRIAGELNQNGVSLVAVSKTKPESDIRSLYDMGHRDFGENYVQEMLGKAAALPPDIRWHFIGHLQTNKVKLIIPFVQLIHGVDSLKLLKEIRKEAAKTGRVVDCLLQVHIAREETKFGFDEKELAGILEEYRSPGWEPVCIRGLMGMASFTDDMSVVRGEFRFLKQLFDRHRSSLSGKNGPAILSMGMSSDYRVAMEEGSTMVRIGSLLFGERAQK